MTTNTREMIIDTEEMYIINPDLLLNFHKWHEPNNKLSPTNYHRNTHFWT